MTKYMLSVVGTVDDAVPSDEQMQEMFATVGRFNDTVRDAGKWVFAGGLAPITTATTVDARGERPTVTDGPFSEAKEFLGGFWIIEADDLDAARRWADADPYAAAGLFDSVQITEWKQVI